MLSNRPPSRLLPSPGLPQEMPILGLDAAACDLLLRLLAADPAARPSAAQVLRHPWLAEVAGLVAPPAQRGGPPGGLEELRRTASELARLGFAAGDREPLQEALQRCAAPLSASRRLLTSCFARSPAPACCWELSGPGRKPWLSCLATVYVV
jgi:serine/threonine protein kinase